MYTWNHSIVPKTNGSSTNSVCVKETLTGCVWVSIKLDRIRTNNLQTPYMFGCVITGMYLPTPCFIVVLYALTENYYLQRITKYDIHYRLVWADELVKDIITILYNSLFLLIHTCHTCMSILKFLQYVVTSIMHLRWYSVYWSHIVDLHIPICIRFATK